ncbi:MAG: MFS transporter [Ktedonobacterales bacterium]
MPGNSTDELSATRRRLGIGVLLGNTFVMNFGFAMLIPLLAIHFTRNLGFTAAAIGLVLALRQFSQQGLDLVGGIVGDRFGARTAIVAGCFVRAAGFLGIGGARSLAPLIFWAIISGIGGAFFDAPGTAALADLVEPGQRQRAYAASATMGNGGQTLGPLLGVALLAVNFEIVSIIAATCFVAAAILTFALLPASALRGPAGTSPAGAAPQRGLHLGLGRTIRALCQDTTFIWLTVMLVGFWFLWAQINITVPLAAVQLGRDRLVALVFAINAGPAIVLQYPLARFASRRYSPRAVLATSVGLSGVGIALVFVSNSVPIFLLGVLIFALARMLIWPTVNAVTADLAPAGMLGAYFGFGALAVAVGAGGGQYAGGFLYDAAHALHQSALLWLTFAIVGMGAAVGLARLALPDRGRRARATPAAKPAARSGK